MAKKTVFLVLISFMVALTVFGCSSPQKYMLAKEEAQKEEAKQDTGLANPATLFCMNTTGAKWQTKEDPEGNQQGICTFSDSSWCDEWDYFRGNCEPGFNYTKCAGQFWGKTVCPTLYEPVCARIEIGNQAPYTVRYERFANACVACISSTRTEVAVGYTHGECPE